MPHNYSSLETVNLRRAVKAWALDNGFSLSPSERFVERSEGEKKLRLQMGYGCLREQVWTPRNYTHGVTGFWRTIHSCPWGSVTLQNGQLSRTRNTCRAFGKKIKGENG